MPLQVLAASLEIVRFVLFISGFSSAQISAPNCSSSWKWSFNSLGQDPCEVTAYMLSTCSGGSFTFGPLQPGYNYIGPAGTDDSNLCKCSTVGYSLISACGGCQGEDWITWSEFTANCTRTLPPSSFPNPIPSGTRVPHWALLDITNGNDWDFKKSYSAGDSPEIGPGTILGPSGPSVSGSSTSKNATTSIAASNTATPIPVGGPNSIVRANAGGIVGGIAAVSVIAATLFFYRRRSMLASAAYAGDGVFDPYMDQVQWPMSGQETATTSPETSASLMKTYDPDDQTTFSGYQGAPSLPYAPAQVSFNKTLYIVAKPTAQEYHGLPIV